MPGKGNYLEDTLDPEAHSLVRAAVTAGWGQDFIAGSANTLAIEGVVFRRCDNAVRFVVPWIESIRALDDLRILDFDPGRGPSAPALARFVRKHLNKVIQCLRS
jgi:hypothetical protein